jgi:hypothetical protein
MGKVVPFKKKQKPVPRGPKGGILLRVGQTWCKINNGEEVTIRKLDPKDSKGKQRVYFAPKRSRRFYWRDLAEMTFRGEYMEKSEYLVFSADTWKRFRQAAEAHGASDGIYRLFDIPTPDEVAEGLKEMEKPRKQPLPKKGELWRSKRPGTRGYVVFVISSVSINDGERIITFETTGLWGAGPAAGFRDDYVRIGWLGDIASQ